ncbi:MAG: endopeptidase La [Chloroflexi bacterium AL-W]|nr:endopeptidase La [Chloroflexi bacterium AL-N1]NOK65835.1 endopeptidase La [Chloroflexi bacterium AL-N10]NOK74224.1 endopeptidase La [Chloroflexi bacterium AL-N5]NOK80868.1 endopeptidase La [Chloroflexi bacterium AL-W]NOK88482.1 endopeptidase La [Chloroflexi bacterium AL-N15]
MSEQTTSTNNNELQTLPLIVLDESVVFPYTAVPFPLTDENTAAAEAGQSDNRLVLLVARREDADADAPLALQLHRVGVVARIEQAGMLPNGSDGLVVRGLVRALLGEQTQTTPYPRFAFTERPDTYERTPELEKLMIEVHAAIDAALDLRPGVPQEIRNFVRSINEPDRLADNTGYSSEYTFQERQDLLETFDVSERLIKVRDFYRKQISLLEVQAKIRKEVQDGAEKQQREFYLRQQMRAIQKELGEDDAEIEELDGLSEKLASANLPEAARKEADRELNRLRRMNEASPEYQMVRTYLEWVAELPWDNVGGEDIDIAHSRQVLDEDHYGLEKVKERILEHLAVKQRLAALNKEQEEETGQSIPTREPILALVGPPGVGKTSLGHSIARALGRKFVRMSLGGVRDEAELRGFRRTYIGSAPGRIIQEMRRAGTSDPVILLDEIDKLGSDYRGDPSAALLEVLDPEQNSTFTDHYLNVPFDLSKVLFIATANTFETVPPALRDRLEVIELSGYIEDEKVHIAERHLIPKQMRANGLAAHEVQVEEPALRNVIRSYTREAGVRTLERQIGTVLRKVTRQISEAEHALPLAVNTEFVQAALGRPRFYNEAKERIDNPGISTGMVWTPVGGDIVFVEVSVVPGRKELRLTGQLGDVMRESAEAALTYVRSRSKMLGIDSHFFDSNAIHIHVPGGAVPKDGPSAGITMATALASAATGRIVRDDVAMTGEITLRGRVLPIGGIKEKALGAHRAGIRTIILPRRNEADLEDLPREVFDELTFVPVETLDEVLATALVPAKSFGSAIQNSFDVVRERVEVQEP